MSVLTEMEKLRTNLANSYISCENKGAVLPENENFDNLAETIDSIEGVNGTTLNITPTYEEQTFTPSDPYNAFTEVNVEAQTGVDINEYFEATPSSSDRRAYKWIKKIPLINTNTFYYFDSLFSEFNNLEEALFTSSANAATFTNTFYACAKLKRFSYMDTSKGTNFQYMLNNCNELEDLQEFDCGKATNIYGMLGGVNKLVNFGGLKDLGKAYLTTQSANYSNYTLTLNGKNLLTHESLMNVINNLYDIATKGCNTQTLNLGATNIAKLTEEEIAIATNKGWTVT